jgi:hypothetical protein
VIRFLTSSRIRERTVTGVDEQNHKRERYTMQWVVAEDERKEKMENWS